MQRRALLGMIASAFAGTAGGAESLPPSARRFLALGDSYTIGEGVAESERWPVRLAHKLRIHDRIEGPEILARTGWTTFELAEAIERHKFHAPYCLVTLLIGVNDQYRGRDLQNYRVDFSALLHRAIEFGDGHAGRVVVVSIPDWGATRFGADSGRELTQIAREIDAFNAANREIAARSGAAWVDVTVLSRDRGDDAAMLAADGLHPSGAMYARWVEAILPAAQHALSSSGL